LHLPTFVNDEHSLSIIVLYSSTDRAGYDL
jgi:hypothetical protein